MTRDYFGIREEEVFRKAVVGLTLTKRKETGPKMIQPGSIPIFFSVTSRVTVAKPQQ